LPRPASTLISNRALCGALIALPALAALALSWFRTFELYELQTYDWRCQLRGARPVSEDIVLIDIWDDTLKELGAWPFDRHYHADLLNVLASAGAKAVALDILFVEPRDGDAAVAQAAKKAANAYFVYAFLDPQQSRGTFTSEKLLAPILEEYALAAKGTGHVNAKADLDGKRRKVFPFIDFEGHRHYQLSFRIAMDLLGVKEEDLDVPLDDEGYFIVNYAGTWQETFQHYSYYDVLAAYLESMQGIPPRIDLAKFKGKICLVGLTSLGSHDTSPVPIQSIYPMVGLHANVLNSILKKDFIRRLGRLTNLLLLLVFAGWIVWMAARLKPVFALAGTVFALGSFAALVIALFLRGGIWADLFYPFALLVVLYAVSTLGRALFEIRKRELIENELKIASQIQQSFLPAALPDAKGLDLAVFMKPAKAVGGDLYHFVPLPDDKLGVMVGDVSGKGTPAALFMAKVVSEFKLYARDREDPGQVLRMLNDSISAESTGGLFVTLTYAIFDRKSKKVLFSNGGHLPMVLVRRSGESRTLEVEEGMPIGVMAGVEFSNAALDLEEGDCLALYSDGISEARNRRKDEYGIPALQARIGSACTLSASGILNASVSDISRFAGKADQHDDMTLVIVKLSSHGNEKQSPLSDR
jgi:CHASE2 domain-containing sensor protein